MATQNCPKCKSDRVRLGYRPTSIFLKMICRYNLLCDNCNWEFTGFAIPGTVRKKTKKRKTENVQINVETEKEKDIVSAILSEREKLDDNPEKEQTATNSSVEVIGRKKSPRTSVRNKKVEQVGVVEPEKSALKKTKVNRKVKSKQV
jgi:hypothetical protein